MRSLNGDIITKSAQTNQTIAAEAEPYVSLRISREKSILTDMALTEKVKVRSVSDNTLSDADIAVKHPRFRGENTQIWVTYIHDGKLGLRWVYDQENITEAKWNTVSLGAPNATACAICFDSQVVENARGIAEFVTSDGNPLIFYVDPDGALHQLTIGGAFIDTVLAGENVTDVSAVRGPSAKHGDWDLGVTVFFIMSGQIFYRQLIDGVWYDAEQVNLGIQGETVVKIDAFNTWDYRVGLQCLTQSGKLYQIITYTEGIGVRGSEHIEMSMSATVTLSGIKYHNRFTNEHVAMAISAGTTLLYAFSAIPLSVQNVEKNNDWGTTIEVMFDYPNTIGTATPSMFTLQDSNGIYYSCTGVALSQSGYKLTLTFADFNSAARAASMTLVYTQPQEGGLMSPAVPTETFSETFVPTGLYNPYEPPAFVRAWNSADGMTIYVEFDEDIIEGISDSNAAHWTIQTSEYTYVPGGMLQTVTHTVATVSAVSGSTNTLALGLNVPNIAPAISGTVVYDGQGSLAGWGGPTAAFNGTFTPSLTWKGNQNDEEHIELNMDITVTLRTIVYHSTKVNDEHIEVALVANNVLTDVHDI